jgi:hypothetical protein
MGARGVFRGWVAVLSLVYLLQGALAFGDEPGGDVLAHYDSGAEMELMNPQFGHFLGRWSLTELWVLSVTLVGSFLMRLVQRRGVVFRGRTFKLTEKPR